MNIYFFTSTSSHKWGCKWGRTLVMLLHSPSVLGVKTCNKTMCDFSETDLASCKHVSFSWCALPIFGWRLWINLILVIFLSFRILESLPKVEKTGNEFLDELLSMVYMVIHTYQDKHQVQCWYVFFGLQTKYCHSHMDTTIQQMCLFQPLNTGLKLCLHWRWIN